MSNYSCAIVIGNLTRDPETREAGTTTMANFSVATSRRTKVNGEWTDKTSYVDCKAFGHSASSLAKYCRKGSKVLVEGELDLEQWEKDGQKRSKLIVIANKVKFLDPPNHGNQQQYSGQSSQSDQGRW